MFAISGVCNIEKHQNQSTVEPSIFICSSLEGKTSKNLRKKIGRTFLDMHFSERGCVNTSDGNDNWVP